MQNFNVCIFINHKILERRRKYPSITSFTKPKVRVNMFILFSLFNFIESNYFLLIVWNPINFYLRLKLIQSYKTYYTFQFVRTFSNQFGSVSTNCEPRAHSSPAAAVCSSYALLYLFHNSIIVPHSLSIILTLVPFTDTMSSALPIVRCLAIASDNSENLHLFDSPSQCMRWI